jgi:proline iminopeptidase
MVQEKNKASVSNYERRSSMLLDLFPEITPYSTGFLDVSDTHSLYWEQSGNPEGVPVLLLHGGPGAGASPTHRRFFCPETYRVIIFDQRGAGRSQPLGELKDNSIHHLINDIELLRNRFQIDKWHIFGGSWGSTLALKYAQSFPERCKSMILRGIFLLEETEVEWFLNGMKNIFPEAWEQFVSILSDEEKQNILQSYYERLTGSNLDLAMEAATSWALYESACSCLFPNFEIITTAEQKDHALALAKIEAHYFLNQVIQKDESILNNINTIRHIPTIIVQGRYDIVCPIKTAHKLHQLWPEADYIVVQDGGHSAMDPSVRSRLIEATETMKSIK